LLRHAIIDPTQASLPSHRSGLAATTTALDPPVDLSTDTRDAQRKIGEIEEGKGAGHPDGPWGRALTVLGELEGVGGLVEEVGGVLVLGAEESPSGQLLVCLLLKVVPARLVVTHRRAIGRCCFAGGGVSRRQRGEIGWVRAWGGGE
jgi:hypothetical protein